MRHPSGDVHVLPPLPGVQAARRQMLVSDLILNPQDAKQKPPTKCTRGRAPTERTFALVLCVCDAHSAIGKQARVVLQQRLRGRQGRRAEQSAAQLCGAQLLLAGGRVKARCELQLLQRKLWHCDSAAAQRDGALCAR